MSHSLKKSEIGTQTFRKNLCINIQAGSRQDIEIASSGQFFIKLQIIILADVLIKQLKLLQFLIILCAMHTYTHVYYEML